MIFGSKIPRDKKPLSVGSCQGVTLEPLKWLRKKKRHLNTWPVNSLIFSNSRTGRRDWDDSRRFCGARIHGHPLERPWDANNPSGRCNLSGELSLGPAGEQKRNYCISNLTQDLARGTTCGFLVFPPAGIEIGSRLLSLAFFFFLPTPEVKAFNPELRRKENS